MTQHVIIGGGPVATNAIETIRQFGDDSPITMICDEPAHSRMALPYWLAGKIPREQTHTADDDSLARLNVDAMIGPRVTSVDSGARSLALDDGSSVAFDNLLIATGSSPLALNIPGIDLPGVQPLWSLAHTQQLLDAVDGNAKPRVAMIGAGFIGFIMLNAMFKRGWDLTVVEREPRVLPRMLDTASAHMVRAWLDQQGVAVHTGRTATAITEADDGAKVLELDDGSTVTADIIVVAIGVKPNVGFLDGSGIDTGDGILVDDHLRTNVAGIYAGGDCAEGPTLFGGREIHAIQPTAVDHGRVIGANMAGQDIAYPGSLAMNVLDVCGLQNASFGDWMNDAAETMVIDNAAGFVYRKLMWTGDVITGAMFSGRANDMGMLTDVGMVKGLIQTGTALGEWKDYLEKNPFDIRRPFVAKQVAAKLKETTLLGRPAQPRAYQFGGKRATTTVGPAHADYVGTKDA